MSMSDRELERTVSAWLMEGATAFPDRALDAVLDEVPRIAQRRHRYLRLRDDGARSAQRLLTAAAVTLALMAGLYVAGRSIADRVPDAPEWRPFPVVEADLEAGRYVIGEPFPIRIGITVPGGFSTPGGIRSTLAQIGTEGGGIGFTFVEGVYAEPCHLEEGLVSPPVGPGAADLATALARLPGVRTSGPTETTIDGFTAYEVTLDAPVDMSTCTGDPPLFRIWGVPEGGWLDPGERARIWVVQVDDLRLVIVTELDREATAEVAAAIDRIVASIDIDPDVSLEAEPQPSAVEVHALPDAGPLVPERRYGFSLRLFEVRPGGGMVPTSAPNRVSLDGYAGWLANGGDAIERRSGDGETVVRVTASTVGRIYMDPCHWRTSDLVDPAMLGSLDSLAVALWAYWGPDPVLGEAYVVPEWAPQATAPIDYPQFGKFAKEVELTVPADLDPIACDGGQYRLWDDGQGRHRTARGPGETIQVWIVDVDPGLAIIDVSVMPDATDADRKALQEFLPTVWIDPPSPVIP